MMASIWTQDDLNAVKAALMDLATGASSTRIQFSSGAGTRSIDNTPLAIKDLEALLAKIQISLNRSACGSSFTLATGKGL